MKRLLTLVVIAVSLASTFFLTAKRVECYTQFGYCSDELAAASQRLKSARLLWPLPYKTAKSLFSSPNVRRITLRRRLPDTLIVNLELSRPLGIVSVSSGESVLVDDAGRILGAATMSGLPVLFVSQLDNYYLPALQALQLISSLTTIPVIGRLEKTDLIVDISNTHVIVKLDKADQNWYTALQVIWERSRIEGKRPRKIDLRFTHPILTY